MISKQFLFFVTIAIGAECASQLSARAGVDIVLANDDGWAQAMVRAQFQALVKDGNDVILCGPATDKSGTGSTSDPTLPTVGSGGCQYSSCPPGSPGLGADPVDPHLNYVNAFPVDAARVGIETLAPVLFGKAPDFFVSGPNYGHNAGSTVLISGTVGAAVEATKRGVPAIAFSAPGESMSAIPYTELTAHPNSTNVRNHQLYADVTVKVVKQVLSKSVPYLPLNVFININYPIIKQDSCDSVDDFKFIFTRNLPNSAVTDFKTCNSSHLPDENSVFSLGCYATVSAISINKVDVDATTQGLVHERVQELVECLPGGLYCSGTAKANGACTTSADCGDLGLSVCGAQGFECLQGKCKKKTGVYCAADLNECLPGHSCVDGDPYIGSVYKHKHCAATTIDSCSQEYQTCLNDAQPVDKCANIRDSCLAEAT